MPVKAEGQQHRFVRPDGKITRRGFLALGGVGALWLTTEALRANKAYELFNLAQVTATPIPETPNGPVTPTPAATIEGTPTPVSQAENVQKLLNTKAGETVS